MKHNENKLIESKPIISIKKVVITLSIICFFSILVSYLIIKSYLSQFNGDYSEVQSEWGDFGSFVSGTIGTLFNLLAVIFSLLSIYITLRIAIRIHENETINNQNTAVREKEKFEREIELTQKQNKPFPVVDYNNLVDKCEILLLNQGPGTLIVTELEISHEGIKYNDFPELIHEKISYDLDYYKVTIVFDAAKKHIVNSGGSKRLFEINNEKVSDEIFQKYKKECSAILELVVVKLKYEDIFENKFEIKESLRV